VKKEVQIEGKKPKKEEGAIPGKGVSCRDQGFDSRGQQKPIADGCREATYRLQLGKCVLAPENRSSSCIAPDDGDKIREDPLPRLITKVIAYRRCLSRLRAALGG